VVDDDPSMCKESSEVHLIDSPSSSCPTSPNAIVIDDIEEFDDEDDSEDDNHNGINEFDYEGGLPLITTISRTTEAALQLQEQCYHAPKETLLQHCCNLTI
jgi:hypothetical protein